MILSELNFLFQKVDVIYNDVSYWNTIREGLHDYDQASRKLALNVLKGNLKAFQDNNRFSAFTKAEFENLWSTFFDIIDTLESFASHYTKAIWHRTDLYYECMKKLDDVYSQPIVKLDPCEDARMWLLVIYHRVASHQNLSIRKYVQKITLDRKFVTPHMKEFFFNEFVAWLNQCLLFKDVNNFHQFSKNADRVIKFYDNFFRNESRDLCGDLRQFYMGFSRNKSQS